MPATTTRLVLLGSGLLVAACSVDGTADTSTTSTEPPETTTTAALDTTTTPGSCDAAQAAATEDGEDSPPTNDYYVRNQNSQLRELEVDPDTPVLWCLSGDPNDSQQCNFGEWIDFLETQDFRLSMWVTISNGEVTEIGEQWVP